MDDAMLRKAASLCRDAAAALRENYSPEKSASEVVDGLLGKGFIREGERGMFLERLASAPEKLAQAKEGLDVLPARLGAIGEVSSDKVAKKGGLDDFDKFLMS